MYTLLNVLKFGLKQVEKSDEIKCTTNEKKLENSLRLDFMSGIFFQVYENLNCEVKDPQRFKLDIQMNTGSVLDPERLNQIDDHCIPISLSENYRKTLTLEDIDSFFLTLLDLQEKDTIT